MSGSPQSADKLEAHDYLQQHGRKLLDNGYQIVPIRPGSKSPGFDGWEKSRPSRDQLNEWLANGFRKAGVGVMTKNTPAIDIDISDERVATLMDQWIRENLGGTLVRVGRFPKRLFVFRCDEPFRKMRTTVRLDEWMQRQQIEVLAEGQQFVAYHLHPDTHRPYEWTDDFENPLDVRAADLPTLKVEQIEKLFAYFEEVADKEGWETKAAGRAKSKALDTDNPFLEDTAPVAMSDDEIRNRLMLVPGSEIYDTWFQVGMALYHQWDGDEPGLTLWHEWSESASNYDRDAVERHWKSFAIEGKKRAPTTVRYILKLSQEAVAQTRIEIGTQLRTAFAAAQDVAAWDKACRETRAAEIDALTRSSIAEIAREARIRITGAKVSLSEIKKAIAYNPDTPKGSEVPAWCKKWVYDVSDDRFFNKESKIAVTQQGFNAMYDREAMTKKDVLEGRTTPSSTASAIALNFYKIKVVDGRRYEPGQDDIFYTVEGCFANTYTEKEHPEIPTKKLPRDQFNVDIVKRHIAHLLADEKEQRMLLDWLSWVVQNPGKFVRYAILLQGTEGDGKSFFAEMMREIMGMSNVTMLNAHIFESNFTDWTVGQCLNCVEEVRLVKAENKYEVINRIKPFITNPVIEVHPKGAKIFNAKNTSSYLLFSNYKDALPLTDDGRRYLVLFSQWQRKIDLMAFKDKNPNYYKRLYEAIYESAGAIREWLLHHEQSPEFDPTGDAPETQARKFMVKQAKSEFIQTLDQIIEEDNCLFADRHLVDITNLPEEFAARGIEWPHMKSLNTQLQRDGYEELGRFRINGDTRYSFWSKTPSLFRVGWEVEIKLVRKHRLQREERLAEHEL